MAAGHEFDTPELITVVALATKEKVGELSIWTKGVWRSFDLHSNPLTYLVLAYAT